MDSISTFLRENYDLVVLFFSVLGVLIAFITLIYEVKKKNGVVKKLKGPKSAAAKRKKTASAVGGILKAILRKVM